MNNVVEFSEINVKIKNRNPLPNSSGGLTLLFHQIFGMPHFSLIFFPECQNYQSLTAADRKITYTTYHGYCDNSITEGWYRFEGAAGTRMPTSCMPSGNRCGTHVIGWLTNGHPRVADGRVKKQVCFSYNGQCCFSNFSKNIYVTNCGSYYVYQLVRPGNCYYRYCGTD